MTEQNNKERLFAFDNLKFFLILFVVVGHFCGDYVESSHLMKSIFIFIYTFHMPLFIFVSGLFHKPYKADDSFRSIRFFYYVFLGFSLKIIMGFISYFCLDSYSFSFLSEGGIAWYLFALAAYEILCYVFRSINKWYVLALVFSIGMVCGYDSSLGTYLVLSRILVYSPFFFVGLYLSPKKVYTFCSKAYIRVFAVLAIISYAILCYFQTNKVYAFRRLFTGLNSFNKVVSIANCGLQHRLITYITAAILCIAFISIMTNRHLPVISVTGSRTLAIYLFHMPVYRFFYYEGYIDKLLSVLPNQWGYVIYLILPVCLTLLLAMKPLSDLLAKISDTLEQKAS